MLDLFWLIPVLPLLGFLALALGGRRVGDRLAARIGCASVGLAAALGLGCLVSFLAAPPEGGAAQAVLWRWMETGGLSADVGLRLDALALVMVLVITCVGFLIHVYSTEFMAGDGGYRRFFASMNLFVATMLVLVLADNLVLLYLGWEGVGLCSYLLIGFWFKEPANGRAARKAFVVTRVGDTAMALGLFLLFTQLGTLNLQEMLGRADEAWAGGSGLATAGAALLLGGAIGKSAQVPLHTWLPDAMAGPTPVSALIHAATMVTAGVYLVARTHGLFLLAPEVLAVVAALGAATLLLGALTALAQRDIKRVLAWSTISQLGYMFLALGVGAFSAAVFHLMTHAFFKAVLFLGAGAVATALHHQHDIARMGGLRRELPAVFWPFLAGTAALAGLPLVTAGFYSKDLILWSAFASERGGLLLWGAGMAGALLTAVYSFRLLFVVFLGEARSQVDHHPGRAMTVPLLVLGALSLVGGFLELPHAMGHVTLFSAFLGAAAPAAVEAPTTSLAAVVLLLLAALASLGGLALAWAWYRRDPTAEKGLPLAEPVSRLFQEGFGFDRLYHALFVRPFTATARANEADVVDRAPTGLASAVAAAGHLLRSTQTGLLRLYAGAILLGAVVLLALAVLL